MYDEPIMLLFSTLLFSDSLAELLEESIELPVYWFSLRLDGDDAWILDLRELLISMTELFVVASVLFFSLRTLM